MTTTEIEALVKEVRQLLVKNPKEALLLQHVVDALLEFSTIRFKPEDQLQKKIEQYCMCGIDSWIAEDNDVNDIKLLLWLIYSRVQP